MKARTRNKAGPKKRIPYCPCPFGRSSAFAFVTCLGLWMPRAYSEVLVDLDATQLAEGPLPGWKNNGTVTGDFTSPANAIPNVTTQRGVKGVTLNGTSQYYTGPAAPERITGAAARTVEAWIFNPAAADEETIFAWGRRGGPDGSNTSFNHGLNPTFGAVGHWGAGPDIGWNGRVATGRWTYVAYAYDGATASVYADGQLANSEEVTLDTWAFDNTPNGNPLRFRVGSQNDANGAPTGTLRGSMTIARIRVHDQALDAATIKANHDAAAQPFDLADEDGDQMPSWYEKTFAFLNPNDASDGTKDQDNDGLTNTEEFLAGAAPDRVDTDGDGISDGAEVKRTVSGASAPTDPLRADTDGDGLSDTAETNTGTFKSVADSGTDPLKVDTDGDTFEDFLEAIRASDPNNTTSVPNAANSPPLVNLDASNVEPGLQSEWQNQGALGGVFTSPANGVPRVQTLSGVRGYTFNGSTAYLTGPPVPSFLTGNASRTIEAWIYNPVAADEETIFAWGRRGGPDGTNTSFNHGRNAAFGAIGHWGAPDIGWDNQIAVGQWTYVVYTYDGTAQTTVVYKDGVEANREELPNPLNTWAVDTAQRRLPFRVASQNDANGNATGPLRGSMTISKIRVYDRVLDANAVKSNYDAEANAFGLIDTDADGLPTWYERQFSVLNPTDASDAPKDSDNDSLTNLQEFQSGTLPDNPDSDDDGLTDSAELNRAGGATNPRNPDSDQDGLSDKAETDGGTDPLNADTDGDTFADGQEVVHGSNPSASASTPNFNTPVALVNLDATALGTGALAEWANTGALGGVFRAASADNAGTVESVQGIKGVTFDGVNDNYIGPIAPVYLTANASRTVDAWIFNPAVNTEETVFAWGRRGGPGGTNASFIHGTDATFGALGQWGAEADVGWNGQLAAGEWTYVAYTYDGATMTATVYKDGAEANTETFGAGLNTWAIDNTPAPGRPLPFRVGVQNNADAGAGGQFASMTIARIRAYDQALSAAAITAKYNEEKTFFSSPAQGLKIDNVSLLGGAFTITWTTAPGKSYSVEASENLKDWTQLAAGLTTGSFTDALLASRTARFYRLREQ